jgi:hypothetical protein
VATLLVDQRVALDWCRRGRSLNGHVNYVAFLASLTQVSNLEACFLTGTQTVFVKNHSPRPCLSDLAHANLYRHNGDAGDDDIVRRYIRRVVGEVESWTVMAGGSGKPMSRPRSSKGVGYATRQS